MNLFEKLRRTPRTYTKQEMAVIEHHIETYFGACEMISHERHSKAIHIDICIIPPNETRNYYTLVTMGMGSYQMNVPKELKNYHLERAELIMALPADWDVYSSDPCYAWPYDILRALANLPLAYKTWLGWGHVIEGDEPFAENTRLNSSILISPQQEDEAADTCTLPNGDEVNFYQVIPLYPEEAASKTNNDAAELADKIKDFIVCLNRPSLIV